MELRGDLRKQKWLSALWTLAQACGAAQKGTVKLVEQSLPKAELFVCSGDESVSVTDFCEAAYKIVSSVEAEESFFGGASNHWIQKAMACDFDISDETLLKELEEALEKQKFLSNQATPDASDFIVYASLKSWIAQTPGDVKMNYKKLVPWFGTIGKTPVFNAMKKEKEKAPKEKAAGERTLDDVTRLDMVVGKIVKATPHPDADALYCEEIDVGESEVRKIATGLRKFVKVEDLEGAMVIVLANMKVKNLRGFPSHGMVMCASNDDRTAFALMRPPPDAKVGDRVTFEGYDALGPPDAVLSNKKNQDPLPVVMPNLKTDASCVGYWKQYKMVVNGSPCKCDNLANAHIS